MHFVNIQVASRLLVNLPLLLSIGMSLFIFFLFFFLAGIAYLTQSLKISFQLYCLNKCQLCPMSVFTYTFCRQNLLYRSISFQ